MNLQFNIPGIVTRKYIGEGKGRGLFAERAFDKGDVIFADKPLFSVQHVYNRSTAWTCGNCFRFLGSLNRQLAHYKKLFQIRDTLEIPEFDHPYNFTTKVFSCFAKCGEKYCSEECRNIAFYSHHQILCVGEQTAENNPIYLFKKHSIETNELFFLAAQAIACLICRIGNDNSEDQFIQNNASTTSTTSTATTTTTSTTSTTSTANTSGTAVHVPLVERICKEFFSEYVNREWWDVRIDGNFTYEEAKTWSHESLELLRKALLPLLQSNPRTNNATFINTILSMEFYSRLLGLLEMNDNSIGFTNPLEMFRKNIDKMNVPQHIKDQSNKAMASIVEAFRDHHSGEDEDCGEDCNEDHHHHGHGGGDSDMMDADDQHMHDDGEQEEEEEIFPPFDGFGIFGLQAMVNHSCIPNCNVVFDGDNRAIIKALRRIEVGEELLHSYIDEDTPIEERAQELITYGFKCDCPKCQAERK